MQKKGLSCHRANQRQPRTSRATMTIAEKIFARHMLDEKGDVGVPSVKPGDTGFARADLRFSHEYVTPMAAIFFEHYVGKDAKVNDPASILFFRDHLTFLDEVISEEKKKTRPARSGHPAQVEAAGLRGEAGNQAARRIEGPQRLRRNLPLHRAGELCAARTAEYRFRLAHAARGRDRMRGLRHRHHRRFQFMDHQRRTRQSSRVGEDRHSRQEASERHRQGFHS